MDKIKRNVGDLGSNERRVYEDALGRKLAENQQIIIQVITVDAGSTSPHNGAGAKASKPLPDWCSVYAGLSDDELADVERVVLQRSDMTRLSE